MRKLISIVAYCVLAGGCASNPDASISYYLAKTEVTVNVVRTATCDTQDQLIVANSATVTPRHFSDFAGPDTRKTINIAELDSEGANTDITFEFFDDGRLKGVNATSAGQGEAILKSALSIVSALFFAEGATDECDYINGYAMKNDQKVRDKTKTLTFEGLAGLTSGATTTIEVRPESAGHFAKLGAALGSVQVEVKKIEKPEPPISRNKGAVDDVVFLEMRQPAQVRLVVEVGKDGKLPPAEVWDGTVAVGQHGKAVKIPISKAALFGKQGFELAVAPSGAVTKIGYSKETGASQVLALGTAISDELSGQTTAEKAAEVKAEADLIAQQQRLVRCQADPKSCE